MTKSTATVEQMEAQVSAFYLWEVVGKPVSIQLSLDLVDRLEKEVLESFKAITKRGSEVGGLLLGRVSAAGRRTVLIEDYELVTCDYNRGPLYLLAEADESRLESAMKRRKTAADKSASVVGYFRSNTRKDLALDEEDQALITAYFSGPENVFLLVKPFSMKPCAAGFFIWEGDRIQGEATYLQFPFKRAELLKGEFAKSVIAGGEKAVAEARPVAPLRGDGAFAAAAVPKREERVTAPPAAFRREVQAPASPAPSKRDEAPATPSKPIEAAAPPSVVPKPEARAAIAPVIPIRGEPAPPPPPVAPKPEARAPIALVIPKRGEPAPPLPAAPKPEARTAVTSPAAPKREEPAPPSVAPKPEARAPVQPVAPKREEPSPARPIAAKRQEPAPAAPAVTRKPEARVPVQPVTPKREEPRPTPPATPKPDVRAPVQAVTPKREERAPAPPVAPKRDEPAAAPLVVEEPAPFLVAGPSAFQRYRVVGALAFLVLVIAIGLWLYFRPRGARGPEVTAAGPDAGSLMLRAERNAGQLLLSWNREAALVKTASKAVLAITDGDHKEDVELDLGQLRNGSIVYSPITNDVSFRLEVTDSKLGRSLNESVRVLAGRPSPAPPTSQTGPPGATAPAGDAKPQQEPAPPAPAPGRPGDGRGGDSATANETSSAPPARPPKSMAPIPAAGRGAESLVARITQSPNLPLPPPVESQVQPTPSGAVGTPAAPAVTPPPAAVKETPQPAPQQPVAQPPAVQTAPAAQPPAAQAAPQEPLKVGGNVQEAKLIRRTIPVYPPLARQARVTGVVRVEATIGKDGKITKVSALSGPPLLRQAATDSVRQWVYQPSLLNGQPVEVVTQVDVSFNLGR